MEANYFNLIQILIKTPCLHKIRPYTMTRMMMMDSTMTTVLTADVMRTTGRGADYYSKSLKTKLQSIANPICKIRQSLKRSWLCQSSIHTKFSCLIQDHRLAKWTHEQGDISLLSWIYKNESLYQAIGEGIWHNEYVTEAYWCEASRWSMGHSRVIQFVWDDQIFFVWQVLNASQESGQGREYLYRQIYRPKQ